MPTIGTYGRTDLDPTVRANPHQFLFASFFSEDSDPCMLVTHSTKSVTKVFKESINNDKTAETRLDGIFYPFIWAIKDEETGNPVLDGTDGDNIFRGNPEGLPSCVLRSVTLHQDGDPEQPATGKEAPSADVDRSKEGISFFALNPFGQYRASAEHGDAIENAEGEDRSGVFGKGIGLRGPAILTGWGYDLVGNPFPSGNTSTENAFAGTIEESGITVRSGHSVNPKDYVSAPIDFRYDQFRNVYTTERYETKRMAYITAGDPVNGYSFSPIATTVDGNLSVISPNTPPYPEGVLPNKAYDVSFSNFITLPAAVMIEIAMFPVSDGNGVSIIPRWVFRNNERSFLARITGGGGPTYTFTPIGTGGAAPGVEQKAFNLVELTHSEGIDTGRDSYPDGFSRQPIPDDAYVEMFRLPPNVEGITGYAWGAQVPSDTKFYFSQVNAHDGECEE